MVVQRNWYFLLIDSYFSKFNIFFLVHAVCLYLESNFNSINYSSNGTLLKVICCDLIPGALISTPLGK